LARAILADEEGDGAVQVEIEATDEREVIGKTILGGEALGHRVDAREVHLPFEGARGAPRGGSAFRHGSTPFLIFADASSPRAPGPDALARSVESFQCRGCPSPVLLQCGMQRTLSWCTLSG